MKVYTIERSVRVPCPIEEVFSFFEKPANLMEMTPLELHFQILTPEPILMQRGTVIDYALKVRGLPIRWRSLISRFDPPHVFVDEQLRGPYDFWHHTHLFKQTLRGTQIMDRVVYAMPLGVLGRVAHRVLVRRQLDRIFHFREAVVAARFGGKSRASRP